MPASHLVARKPVAANSGFFDQDEMNAMAFGGSMRSTAASRPSDRAIGSLLTLALHGALAAVVLVVLTAPHPELPSATIMVSMITAPTPKAVQPQPTQLPKPLPVARSPLPPPRSLLATPAQTPASTAPAEQAPAPPPASPPTPAVETAVTLPRFDAAYLDNPAPPYPPLARRMREQGNVLLRVLVNSAGTAERVELKTSSGSTRLDQSALETVKHWRYVPARQGSQAVTSWVLVPISFTLGG